MSEITIIEKPEWISYDDIHRVLYDAHSSNREIGFNVATAEMSSEKLEEHVGKTGKTYVALDGNKLVGTVSYRILNRKYWCAKGEVGEIILLGILPEYKGQHISSKLSLRACEEILANGCRYLEARTAEENIIVQKMCMKSGFRYIGFSAPPADHYDVLMLKWLDKCPYSKLHTDLHFYAKRLYVKLRFKKGRIKRF